MNPLEMQADFYRRVLEEKGYRLERQEIPLDHADSCCRFSPSDKPNVATQEAIKIHGMEVIGLALSYLFLLAQVHKGLDYLQVFDAPEGKEKLWFIEDGEGGAITALLPSDY